MLNRIEWYVDDPVLIEDHLEIILSGLIPGWESKSIIIDPSPHMNP